MNWIVQLSETIYDHIRPVLLEPVNPRGRLFWLYLVSSVAVAYLVFRAAISTTAHPMGQDAEDADGSFLRFLFPKRVWTQPSAWLDLRYVFVHRIVFSSVLLTSSVVGVAVGYDFLAGGRSAADIVSREDSTTIGEWMAVVGFMLVLFVVADFTAWVIHYLQHKIPVLWQFHKVHHSAEVMHPISNYREHPVDNLTYSFFGGVSSGAVIALAVRSFGTVPPLPTLIGVSVFAFMFNFVAYNLRHSHVWLRWPGAWSIAFPSPAHHHVHHSRHPDHIDKNFAFMSPVWDVIFGTYVMPEDNRDVEFGVTEGDDEGLDSVLGLYWVPFRDAYRVLTSTGQNKPNVTEPGDDLEALQTDV